MGLTPDDMYHGRSERSWAAGKRFNDWHRDEEGRRILATRPSRKWERERSL